MGTDSKARIRAVLWRDAHGVKDEDNLADTLRSHRPALYWSVGVLVKSDEIGVTISQDLGIPLGDDEETTYRTRTFIPRELVEREYDAGPVYRRPREKKNAVPGETEVRG